MTRELTPDEAWIRILAHELVYITDAENGAVISTKNMTEMRAFKWIMRAKTDDRVSFHITLEDPA